MSSGVRLQEPFVDGDRKIYPVVAEASVSVGNGMIGSLVPLALIIEEDGTYSYMLLAADSLVAVLEKLADLYI